MSDSHADAGQARADGASRRVQALDIFPTRVWQTRLTELDHLLPEWARAAKALRAASPDSQKRSTRAGWASGDLVGADRAPFEPLLAAIGSGCSAVLQEIGWGGAPFQLHPWINIHTTNGYNVLHMHVGALLTGCFYLQAPPGSGSLVLRDPRPGVHHSGVRGHRPNALVDVSLRPEAGLLRIFPPWLEHFVEPNEDAAERITLAFNVIGPRPG